MMSRRQSERPRRGRGEGSIGKRADGRWEAKFSIPNDGRRERHSVYGLTREEVVTKMLTRKADLTRGIRPANERLTVATYLNEWLAAKQNTARPSTFTTYEGIV